MNPATATATKQAEGPVRAASDWVRDYPVREYVAAMARELAHMARWDGDDGLAEALEGVAEHAERTRPPGLTR